MKAQPPQYSLHSPVDVRRDLARRLRAIRLDKGWKQATLAERSGVSLGSLRRFERSGKISLESLLALASTLNRLGDFDTVFERPPARTMAELEALDEPGRQRGHL